MAKGIPNEEDKLMIETLYEIGCRQKQIRLLRINHLHIGDKTVFIRGKNENERYIKMEKTLFTRLYNFILGNTMNYKKEYCFVNPSTQKPWSDGWLLRRVKFYYKELIGGGKRITPHTFRRSFATNHYNNGLDIKKI